MTHLISDFYQPKPVDSKTEDIILSPADPFLQPLVPTDWQYNLVRQARSNPTAPSLTHPCPAPTLARHPQEAAAACHLQGPAPTRHCHDPAPARRPQGPVPALHPRGPTTPRRLQGPAPARRPQEPVPVRRLQGPAHACLPSPFHDPPVMNMQAILIQ